MRDLPSLAHGIQRCLKCRLSEERTHAVPGEGPEDAEVMLVGKAPGREEDQEGRPFVGMAGTVLDDLLEESGWKRSRLFITSVVKCRPPENRRPGQDELETCVAAWLHAQIRAVEPALIILLGAVATEAVLDRRGRLDQMAGETAVRNGRRYLVTYHPAGAMRSPERRSAMVDQLQGAHGLLG